jgi:hypothetical protein
VKREVWVNDLLIAPTRHPRPAGMVMLPRGGAEAFNSVLELVQKCLPRGSDDSGELARFIAGRLAPWNLDRWISRDQRTTYNVAQSVREALAAVALKEGRGIKVSNARNLETNALAPETFDSVHASRYWLRAHPHLDSRRSIRYENIHALLGAGDPDKYVAGARLAGYGRHVGAYSSNFPFLILDVQYLQAAKARYGDAVYPLHTPSDRASSPGDDDDDDAAPFLWPRYHLGDWSVKCERRPAHALVRAERMYGDGSDGLSSLLRALFAPHVRDPAVLDRMALGISLFPCWNLDYVVFAPEQGATPVQFIFTPDARIVLYVCAVRVGACVDADPAARAAHYLHAVRQELGRPTLAASEVNSLAKLRAMAPGGNVKQLERIAAHCAPYTVIKGGSRVLWGLDTRSVM